VASYQEFDIEEWK